LPATRAVVVRGDFTETSGYAAGRTLGERRSRPAAVFAANDAMAIGCLAAFDALGLATPRDIAVAGFDDIPLAAFVRPALTTMRVQIVELGRGAVVQLAGAIAHPEGRRPVTTMLRPELVVRESSGGGAARGVVNHGQATSDRAHDERDGHRKESRTRGARRPAVPAATPAQGRQARRRAPAARR
jgi:LacI family transcriptional regulator